MFGNIIEWKNGKARVAGVSLGLIYKRCSREVVLREPTRNR